jgi:hypothetical protein
MKVEMRDIGQIKPYENNPRINVAAVDAVAKSILEFGFRQPIVVDENDETIVGQGNRRGGSRRVVRLHYSSGVLAHVGGIEARQFAVLLRWACQPASGTRHFGPSFRGLLT